jgi:ribA/ribD-fused uncharacterized protein
MMAYISFTKTELPYGWLGNMFAAPITYQGQIWRTSEALFQALRFEDLTIREMIRNDKSPMGAKLVAKRKEYKTKRVVEPMSMEDIDNMRLCLRIKFDQHPDLREKLLKTGDHIIFENISARPKTPRNKFWGAVKNAGKLDGNNMLGKLLMELRVEIKNEDGFLP